MGNTFPKLGVTFSVTVGNTFYSWRYHLSKKLGVKPAKLGVKKCAREMHTQRTRRTKNGIFCAFRQPGVKK